MSNAELIKRLRLTALIILVAGLFSAALIYGFAVDVTDPSTGYVIVDGTSYPYSVRDSKMYRHDMERFGGKTLVMFDDFYYWFKGLWRGKALARSVAWISVLVSLGIYLFARALPDNLSDGQDSPGHDNPDAPERNRQEAPGGSKPD